MSLGLKFVYMSVPPYIGNNLRVWMSHFISSVVLGGRDVAWCLDLCYLFWGWGKCSFEIQFCWGMGVVLLGILRGLFFH